MAVPRWQYIPTAVLDDEELANQSRAWSDQQSKLIADEWARSNVPDPLAPLRRANPHLARVEQDLVRPPAEPAEPPVTQGILGDTSSLGTQPRPAAQGRSPFRDTSQFGQPGISQAEAYAVCGPAAAVRLASVYGNDIPLAEALKAAREVGWTEQGGMNGIANQKRLLDNLGVPTTVDLRPTNDKIVADAITGNPVTISTPKHYFTVSNYDPQSGKLYVGKSGIDLKGGSDWMTLDEIKQRGGGINGALFANNPQTELPSPAVKNSGGMREGGSLQDMAYNTALKFGLDPDIFTRQLQQESGFNPSAKSPAGARGVAQFMPGTAAGVAKQLGVSLDEFWKDPGLQIQGAAQHMTDLLSQFGGDIKLALAAYNAGPGNVQKYGGVPPFEETQRYIERILGGAATLASSPGAAIAAKVSSKVPALEPVATKLAEASDFGGQMLSGASRDLLRQRQQPNPLAPFAPGLNMPDIGGAVSAGAQAAGVPGRKQTEQYLPIEVGGQKLGEIPLGPSELIGFAAGMSVPGGPNTKGASLTRTAATAGEEVVDSLMGQLFQKTRRMFHGTSSEFSRPSPSKFDPHGLYGPGYYLTSDPRVAGGHVSSGAKRWFVMYDEMNQRVGDDAGYATQREAEQAVKDLKERARAYDQFPSFSVAEDVVLAPAGEVLASGYAQNRAAKGAAGANVRPVDVPQDLKLLDMNAPLSLDEARRIWRATVGGPPPDESIYEIGRKGMTDLDGDGLYQLMREELSDRAAMHARERPWEEAQDLAARMQALNKGLAKAGFDGLKHKGGSIRAMTDESGKAIEHDVVVIFEDSLYRIRNALSGRLGGSASTEFASTLGGGTAGGVGGYASTPEDASMEERLGRTAGGALMGGLLGRHFAGAGRRQQGSFHIPGGTPPGGALPPGPPGPRAPTPGGPGRGDLNDIFNMFERNREVRNAKPTIKERLSGMGLEFERQMTDRFVDLNRLGRNVEVAVSTYLGRLPGAQQRVIDEFTPWRDALGGDVATNGRSMVDNFNAFVKLQRDKEVALAKSPMVTVAGTAASTGRGVLRGSPVIASGPSGVRQSSAGGTGAAHADSMLLELQGQLSPKEWQRVLDADRIRQEALDRMLDDRVQSGLISNELRQWLLANYPHYNPTVAMRNVDEALMSSGGGKSMNVLTNNIRKLMDKGITGDTEEPSISAIRYVMRSDLDIRRNNTVRSIIDALEAQGNLGKKVRATTPGDKPGTLSWYEGGVRWRAEVPKEVERAAKMMDDNTMNWFFRAGQLLNTPLRLAAVTLSPSFIIMNTAADLLTTYIREGGAAAARVPAKHVRAVGQALQPDRFPISESERRFVRAGGGMSAIAQTTEGADIEKLIRESGGLVFNDMPAWRRFLGEIGTLAPLRRYGEAVERGPRVAAFEAALAREAPGRGTTGLATPGGGGFGRGSEASAAMAGRRATIDFARAGQSIRLANTWALFLNARVQGATQMVRTLRDNPNAKWRLASVIAPVAATYAWNRQFPEEYADIPDWEKRSNAIVILGPGERDPQGGFKSVPRLSFPLREWAAFAAPLAFAFEQIDKKEPRTWDVAAAEVAAGVPGVLGGIARGASPVSGESAESSIMGMMPSPLRTPISLAMNEKFFTGSPIESARMEDLPPSEKVTDRTTGVAKVGSEALRAAGAKGLSPVQLDFIIQENLAGLGRMVTGERINPLEAIHRTSAGQGDTNKFKKMDQELEQTRERVAEITRSNPEYAKATKDRQLQMLRQDQLALEEQLKVKYGISTTTRDYGLPPKYRNVNDPAKEKQIDQAITKYEAWLRDRNARPSDRVGAARPNREEMRLASRYNKEVMRNASRTRMMQQQRRANESRSLSVQGLVGAAR